MRSTSRRCPSRPSTLSGNGRPISARNIDEVGAVQRDLHLEHVDVDLGRQHLHPDLSGSEGSTLNLTVQQNAIQNGRTAPPASTSRGTEEPDREHQSEHRSRDPGQSNEAVRINSTSTNDLATISVTDNSFTAGGSGSTGFDIATAGRRIDAHREYGPVQCDQRHRFKFSLGPGDGRRCQQFGRGYDRRSDRNSPARSPAPAASPSTTTARQSGQPRFLVDRGIIFSSVTDPTISNVTYIPTLVGTQSNTDPGPLFHSRSPANRPRAQSWSTARSCRDTPACDVDCSRSFVRRRGSAPVRLSCEEPAAA